jgi:hypothetical protein
MGQVTHKIFLGVDAGDAPHKLFEVREGDYCDGWPLLTVRYSNYLLESGQRPDLKPGSNNHHLRLTCGSADPHGRRGDGPWNLIGFFIAGGRRTVGLDFGFRLADGFLSVPEYKDAYEKGLAAWEKFRAWALDHGYHFTAPELWLLQGEY